MSIDSIKAQEDACVLPAFDSDVAFTLGTIIRAQCQRNHTRPAVVYIAHANSRKEAVVLRWGTSTIRMRMQLEQTLPGTTTQQALKDKFEVTDPSVYACHGGGTVEGVAGVIVVSGLKQEDDHGVIVDGIQEYLKSLNN
ncbi:hypothetical protein EV363DRAFT_1349537 [Boletus edulis]|nr:hypothetical protein EV363DRAFT_1349537 [Boletus edulis]